MSEKGEVLTMIVGSQMNSESPAVRRPGRPAKKLGLMRLALLERLKRESLRSIAKSLGVSHSTLRERITKADIVPGADYGRIWRKGHRIRIYKEAGNGN